MKKLTFPLIWILVLLIFFSPIFRGKMPAPLDTIVGLYHPWRDVVWDNFNSGVPYKNFLITDPVRQQIPYRFLAVGKIKNGEIFSWNPYSFSGTPLSSNIQTGQYYPLNIIFFILPFTVSWSLIIILGPFLAGVFLYSYLRFLKLSKISCLLGSIAFSLSGFFIAWLEWGTLTHALLWLPLILLAKEKLLNKISIIWVLILIFSEVSQLLAGHLQISLYVLFFSTIYLFLKILTLSKNKIRSIFIKNIILKTFPFILISIPVFFLISIQYIPLIKFILLSARSYDLPSWNSSSWFLPWQQLVQFIVPDFFGNPATLNYFGEWNYGEFISYIGIIPLIFSFLAIIKRNDKKTRFFAISFLVTLLFILPNPISKIPFILNIPLITTAQPTRQISIIVFCLSVLSALGFDYYLNNQKKSQRALKMLILLFGAVLLSIWGLTLGVKGLISPVTKNNLILPTILIIVSFLIFYLLSKFKSKFLVYLVIVIVFLDLLRFGRKFTSFSNTSWFYPKTNIINFLNSQSKPYRIMTADRRIFPPNFSIMYHIEDVAGYDPLYLLNYAQLVQAWSSNSPDINPGKFNRILTPQNYDSFITDLLNVKYVLSLSDLNSAKLVLKYQEGETRVYENINSFPRAYFVEDYIKAKDLQDEVNLMFSLSGNLRKVAISREYINIKASKIQSNEKVEIIKKEENSFVLKTYTQAERLLVISEIHYPSWKVYIDNQESLVYKVNIALRGVIVPEGEHIIQFRYKEI